MAGHGERPRKKLKDAAAQLVTGGGDIEDAARRARVPVKVLQQSEQWRDVEIWPDQAMTVDVFASMLTQWRCGPSGVSGLDYGALPAVMQLLGVPRKMRQDVFAGLRIMEQAALSALRS